MALYRGAGGKKEQGKHFSSLVFNPRHGAVGEVKPSRMLSERRAGGKGIKGEKEMTEGSS